VPSAELDDVLARLQAIPSIDEVIPLPTCNRVEASAVADGPAEPVTRAVIDQLAWGLAGRHAVVLGTGSIGKLAAWPPRLPTPTSWSLPPAPPRPLPRAAPLS
jgi:hypothetical protein